MKKQLFILLLVFSLGCVSATQVIRPQRKLISFYQIELQKPNGDPFSFSQFRGKVVLVDFFTSSCFPCLNIPPQLSKAWKSRKSKGFEVVGIALDQQKQLLSMYVQSVPIVYPVVVADKMIFEHKTVLGDGKTIPMQILIDRCGKAVRFHISRELPSNLLKEIDFFLNQKDSCS